MNELNLLLQQMMPPAIGNPPFTSNRIVTAAVSQPLAVEMIDRCAGASCIRCVASEKGWRNKH